MRRSAAANGLGAAQQVQRADDLVAEPHRQGLHGAESRLDGGRREPRPPLIRVGQVGRGDRLAGAEAVQARSLVILDLEQLDQASCLAGCRRDPQLTAGVGQHHAGRGRGQQGHTAVGEHVQEVNDVKVSHHRVGQAHEGIGEQFRVHEFTFSW